MLFFYFLPNDFLLKVILSVAKRYLRFIGI